MNTIPYATIAVSGADAFDFLQAQLAADLQRLQSTTAPILAAWCNPKGRVICVFRASRSGEDFMLALPEELADGVLQRLAMFRFRSKVEFAQHDADPEHLGSESSIDAWRRDNLRAGIVEIVTQQSEKWTPHMLNLDLLDAVSVDKGCYPGQEIVARTHYRGATKRRTLRFQCEGGVAAGDTVSDGERDVGEVLNAIANEVLAVVPLDKKNQQLNVNGSALLNLPLQYLEE